jgi:ribosomal protein S18 acetylase RimI-like enzyme
MKNHSGTCGARNGGLFGRKENREDLMEVQIRMATAADCDAIGALMAAMATHYGGPEDAVEEKAAALMVATTLATQEGTRFLLAVDASPPAAKPVGMACFVVIRPGRRLQGLIYLKDLFVPAANRGQGIGRQLMAQLAQFAIANDIGRIDLRTSGSNVGAQRLYEALGGVRQDKIAYTFDPATLRSR